MSSFLLLTGMPGCGKTTMVRRLVKDLQETQGVQSLSGFYTEEVRNFENERIGFDVVSLDGERCPLARVNSEITSTNRPAEGTNSRVGKYVVFVQEFESLGMKLIATTDENSLLVIDEVGRMELFSSRFEASIKQLLTTKKNLKVLATVPLKSQAKLIDQLKNFPRSEIFHLTKSNRDEMYKNVLQSLRKLVRSDR